ncbi:YdeI/OmpD-associated family protein [Chloroflexi bacterium TSY]|nr:YdeI/OmpD-associated family protein [Chloroflexi bacterium TSY]
MEQSFQTTVQKKGSQVFIELPFNPNDVWRRKQRHYTHGLINDVRIRSLLKEKDGVYLISLGAAWRRDSGIEAGDTVTVSLEPEGPQRETIAKDIADALEQEGAAGEFFDSLATFYRRNYINWVEDAKKPETRSARIIEMVTLLKAGKQQK